jgi:hypothetical protein
MSTNILPIKIERLKEVEQFINEHKWHEDNWKALYGKLQEEIRIETARSSDRLANPYLNELIQTMEKQAEEYLHAPKKQKSGKFRTFCDDFYQDVRFGLYS